MPIAEQPNHVYSATMVVDFAPEPKCGICDDTKEVYDLYEEVICPCPECDPKKYAKYEAQLEQ